MNKNSLLLLMALLMLSLVNVQAEDLTTRTEEEVVISTGNDGVPLSKNEMKLLWEQMKKVPINKRNDLTLDLSTNQVLQMKQWLSQVAKKNKNWGSALCVGGIVGLVAFPVASAEKGDDGKTKFQAWGWAAGIGSLVALCIPGYTLWKSGSNKSKTAQYLIADNPVRHEMNYMNIMASTGLKILSDQNNKPAIGAGVTITF